MKTEINPRTFFKLKSAVFAAAIACSIILSSGASAQLSGTKNIPGDYATISAAVTDLNAQGVGAGGVTFNVAVGYTETIAARINLTATGTAANPIIFQKIGVGANPIITAYVGTATPASAAPDGIWSLAGSDFVTIDGIDLTDPNAANPATMEYGYGLFKASLSDGAQSNTIKNCVVTLNKINNASSTAPMVEGSVGILVINSTPTAATTSLTPGTAAGANSLNKFYTNTIQNCNYGIALSGYAATTPFTAGDTGNDIGGTSAATGNTIINFGGAAAAVNPAAGIRANNEFGTVTNPMNMSFNTLNNNNGAGVNHVTTLRGIYGQAGTSAFATINNNTITIKCGATTSTPFGIDNGIGSTTASNTVSINNNVVNIGYNTATSGVMTGINNSATATTVNINGNTIQGIGGVPLSGTGTHLMIETGSPTTVTTNSNIVQNLVRDGASGSWRGIKTTSPTNWTCNSNTITNLSWTAVASTGSIDAIYSFSTAVNVTANNNGITLLSTPTTGTITGINEFGSSGLKTFQNNTISNFSTTAGGVGGATLRGISESTGSTNDISGNKIFSLNSTGTTGGTSGTIVGITVSSGTTNNIYKNKIYDLSSTSTGPTVSGITQSGGTTNTIYNNLIGDLRATAATVASPASAIIGINLTSSTSSSSINVYYNSVYVNATSTGANFATTGIFHAASATSTTAALSLRNNVIVNTSTPAGTGLTVAYRRSLGTAGTLANYASTSNNNDFYAGTPGASRLIYSDGTSTAQTINAYKGGVFTAGTIAPRDSASFTENPPFLSTTGSSANFLHIDPSIATQLESGGTTVTGITDDFDGNTRNATTPDVGADEFSGIALDLSPPVISYTALGNGVVTASRSFANVTVTDATGVNTTAGTRPRVYYKKTSDANNTFNDNTSGTVGWKYVEASGAGGSPFSFTIDYSLLFGGTGVSVGDTVQYFVVAQDTVATPNVGINSGIFNATPASVALTASAFPITGSINSYSILGSISGSFNVGTGQTYATLTAAVADINGKVLNGPVVLNLTDSSYTTGPGQEPKGPGETFPITINANGGSSATNTITIKPASGVTAAITNSSASSIIKLNGASWVIVDGSNNGTSSRDLTITNSSTAATTAAMWLASAGTGAGSTNNTIKNTNILAGSSTVASTYGIALSGATIGTAGADNDNNTIQNNTISTVYYGIYANGTAAVSAGGDDGLAITNNLIGPAASGATNTGFAGIWLQNALTATISGNTVRNVTTTVGSTGGIYLNSNVNGATVSQNTITNITSTASSTGTASITALYLGNSVFNTTVSRNTITTVASTTTSGYGVRAVIVNTGFSGSNDTIVNNMISDVYNYQDATVTLYATIGIDIDASGGINVYDNSINLFGDHPGYVSNTTGGVSAALFVNTTGTGLDIRDNILSNSYNNTTSTGDKSYAIYSLSANTVFSAVDYNLYYVAGNGTPVLGFIASTDQATLAAVQASFGGNTHSVVGNPQFISATDLHINPSIATLVESGGTPIAGITVDLDGDTRNATTPDIGADEGNFTQVVTNDMQATAFIDPPNGGGKLAGASFSPQASFSNNGTATQTNVTVRYRILDAGSNEVYNNAGTIASIASITTTTVTFASTSLPAGTYTIKAKSELAGDQVPANDEITGTLIVSAPLSGNYTVGSTGNYSTLTQAVNQLNGLGVSGPVVLTLTDSSYTRPDQPATETYPITINAIPGASSTNTVTIKPANPGTTITGSSASALIILNGTHYVTIDGSSNGTSSRDLTITNSNPGAATAVVWVKSNGVSPAAATDDMIKNCNLVGGSVSGAYGVAISGTTIGTAGADNSNISIQNNSISTVNYGIYANGTAATSPGACFNLIITDNVIGPAVSGATNTGFAGIWLGNAIGPSIVNNTVRNLTTSSSNAAGIRLDSNVNGGGVVQNILTNINSSAIASGTAGITGIYLGSAVINFTVSRNTITTVVSTTTSGYTARGIMVNSGIAASNDTVVNNFITDVYCFEDASNIYWPIGIALEGASGGINIFANSVNLFGSHPGYSSNTTGGAAPAMFNNSTGSSIDIRDNVFTSSYENTTSTGDKAYAIYSVAANTVYADINYNDYYASGPGIPVLGFLGADQTTIAAWRTATGKDVNSKNVDPLFVSATNLHLQLSSTLLGMGISIAGVTTDIDGDLRQNPPDIGADEIITYTLTYTAGVNGTISGTSPQTVLSGGSGTAVTAVPNTGYHFVNWSDSSTANPRTDTNVTADISVTANFAINTYTLTYTADANGTISGTTPQTVNYGASGTPVTAVPNTGYHFVNWSDASTANPRTDTNVMADVSVTANFAINTYTLTYTAGPNGSISGTSPQTVNYGDSGTPVTAVPNTGYHFVNWSDASTDNPRTDTNVMADITVQANFDNSPPTISDIADTSTNEDTARGPIAFTVGDAETPAGSLTVSGSSSDATLVPNANIVFGGSGANRTVTVTPAADQNGTATITVSVSDGTNTTSDTFVLTVNAVNDAPSFTRGADQTVLEDAGAQSVTGWATNISPGPANESGQTVNFIVTNNNNPLFSTQPAVSATGDLTYTLAANANGTAIVSVSIHDNGGVLNGGVDTSAIQTFNINVTAVNDAPTLNAIPDPAPIPQNSGLQTVNLSGISAGPANESAQTLAVTAVSNNTGLIPNPTVTYTSPNATGSLSYTPVAGQSGSAQITVTVMDNGGTLNGGVNSFVRQFTVVVTATINGPVNVTATAGTATGNYATLKAAFDAINLGTHQGTIAITIDGDTTETATAALNASGVGSASYATISVQPNGGAARTISGSLAAPLIDLNGADNVTINGLNTGGNSLTISNTDTGAATSTIRFINGASNNTVTNCSVLGSSTGAVAAASGTILISTSTGGANTGNTVSNNNIGPAGANLPTKGVTSLGSASPNNNTLNVIDNNNIFDFFNATTSVSGISVQSNSDSSTISNNRIYQTAPRVFTGTVLRYAGITLNATGAFNVTGNTIGLGAANGTGTTTISGSTNTFRGIDAASTSTTTATSIQGNTISGINQTTASTGTGITTGFVAIMLGSTDGLFNVGNVTGNNIGSLGGASTIVINSTAGTGVVYGIFNFSLSGTNISNNNIGSITIQGAGATNGFRGILVNTASSTAALATINNNTVANITDTQVGNYAMYAIQISLPPVSMTGNVTRNLTGSANGGVVVMAGISVSNASSTIASTISQNTVHSLSDTVTGGAVGAVYAMDLTLSTNAGNLVERNLVHSVNVNSTFTTYQIYGIIARTQGVATYKNNMIRLGLDAAGNSITTGFSIIGIRDSAGTTSANNYYNNSVYIGGTGVVSASNTYAMLSDVVTNTRNFVDNIFWNARSNGTGTIGNVAIRVGGTAPNPAGLTSNYNILYASGNNGVTGVFNGFIIPTLADWRAATGQDANSIAGNPQFIAPNGTAATGDLHISPVNPTPIEAAGILVASVTDDFDGQTRASLTPTDIGADAGNFVANTPPTISAVPVSRQQGSPVLNSPIANVNDAESGAGAVVVTVTSANPSNGVTISNIVNTAGTVTADVVASCIATNATFTLQASDGTSVNTANLTVTVTANTAPTLTYSAASVANGGSTTVNPASGPSDNGSVSTIVVQSAGTYTGTISVDNVTGIVSISSAAPIGSHTITIRATDNCGATTDATFTLNVTNNNPSITAGAPVTRQQGSAGTTAMIATVSDPDQSAGSLTVTATTVPAGISVTDITNTNGTVTATVAADCTAAVGANTVVLTVTDSNSGTATANFTVNVTANTAPTLTYNNAAVSYNGSTSVNPATGPSDNGSVSTIVVQSQGTYTGTISVDNVTGIVSISNATPAGSHTITIRATDNCGATTDATFTLTVSAHVAPVVTNTNDSGVDSLRQALLDVLDGETITFNIPIGDPGYSGGVWTISLTTGELVVDKNVTINGLGANVLVVRRDPSASAFRVFHVTSGLSGAGDAPIGTPAGVTIQGMTISGGVSNSGLFGGAGGGIYNDHTNLTVNACALSGNSAVYGGAIISDGLNGTASLAITNSTLSGNSASGDSLASGGGVMNYGYNGSVPLNVANSTFSQNSASNRGGGIFNYGETGSAPLNITNSTFSQNSSTNGGGAIFNSFGATTIGNSILKTGVSGPNIDGGGGSITSSGYNLSNDNGGGFLTATGDQINTDPILGPLKDNGGTTLTHAPLSNSPAIDRGKDIGATGQDQRGAVRPVTYDGSITPPAGGDRSDIGAVELAVGVQPISAVSQKTHGAAGPFDVILPLTGTPAIECRSGGVTNDYRVIFTFASPVTFTSAAVSSGTGSVAASSGSGTTTVTVDLTGVTDIQTITVALFNANNGTNGGDVGIRMSVLVGDTNADPAVDGADVAQTKAESGHVVSVLNFREDVNANGAINVSDVGLVKSKSGNVLPPPL